MHTKLSNKGYIILKKYFSEAQLKDFRKELKVQPYTPYRSKFAPPNCFNVFLESQNKMYIPRFWGVKIIGEPDKYNINEGLSINLKFNGSLREVQEKAINAYFNNYKSDKYCGGIICLGCGMGKTVVAINIISRINKKTLIVVHKEFLMNQWIERINQFLPEAKIGIIQQKKFDVQGKDIVLCMLQTLSMKKFDDDAFDCFGLSIVDECFPANTYIHTSEGSKSIYTLYNNWKNNKSSIDILSFNLETKQFEYKPLTYAWQKTNKELLEISMSKKKIKCTYNHKILTTKGYICASDLKINDIILSKYDTNHQDNIIAPALNNDQLQIIYGSYLGDGNISHTNKNRYRLRIIHCESQKEYCLWKSNMFGINKLEFIKQNGYSKKTAVRFNSKIFDLDNEIPKNTKIVPDWLLNNLNEKGIAIWLMDDGSFNKNNIRIHSNYYDLDTHNKFVSKFKTYNIDCTIHKSKKKYYYLNFNKQNTEKLINLVKSYIHSSMLYKINNITVSNNYEWDNKFLNYGTLKVSNIKRIENKTLYVYDIEVKDNHNFIIATKIHTKNQQQYIDGPIVSNCHHISSEVFSQALPKISTKYTLGLTATPTRADGLTKVFEWYLGKICYKGKRTDAQQVIVKVINYKSDDSNYIKLEEGFEGRIITSRMINNVCDYKPRLKLLVQEINKIMQEKERKMIILSDRRNHLELIEKYLKKMKLDFTIGYYVGGMKQSLLDESEKCDIILSTFNMASEALDIPDLNSLILSSPKSNFEQSVGRILRKKHNIKPLVIDIKDCFIPFDKQYNKRKKFYNKNKYKIIEINVDDNEVNNKDKYNNILDKYKNVHNDDKVIESDSTSSIEDNLLEETNNTQVRKCEIFSDSD